MRIPINGKLHSTEMGVNLTLTIAGLVGDVTGLLPHPDPTSSIQRASHQQDFVLCGCGSTFQWHAWSLWKALRDGSASGHRPSAYLTSHQGHLRGKWWSCLAAFAKQYSQHSILHCIGTFNASAIPFLVILSVAYVTFLLMFHAICV